MRDFKNFGPANITLLFLDIELNKFLIDNSSISISACVNRKKSVLIFEIKKFVALGRPIFLFE